MNDRRRTFVKWMASGAAVATVPVLVACGGGGGGGGDPAQGGAQGGLSDAERREAITSVEDTSRRLAVTTVTRLQFVQAMAAHMRAQGAYAEAGYDEEALCAWGVFKDGRAHIVAYNRLPVPAEADVATGTAPRERPLALANGLPGVRDARLMHTFGTGFDGQSTITDLTDWLTTAGYQVRSGGQEGDGRLTALRAVQGDGFFYINTHGGTGKLVMPGGSSGIEVFSIQSSTLVNETLENTPEMQADIADGRLTYMTATNGLTKEILGFEYPDFDTRYGITDNFVRAYWQFSRNSVVLINACVSALPAFGSGRPLAAPFYNACLAKGAGVYLGWTHNVSATGAFTVARRFADRLLGANEYQPEAPHQRAFMVDDVMAEMGRKGLVNDPEGLAVFVARKDGGRAPMMVPGIKELIVDEFRDELVLVGDFGPQETTGANVGRVTVDGQDRSVLSWSESRIACALPRTGAGSAGAVRVHVGEHRSNVRWITRWTTTLNYRWEDPARAGLRVTGVATIRHRADVGRTRARPGDAPESPVRYAVATRDSSLPLQASGSRNEGSDCTITWSGSATFPGTHLENGRVLFGDLMINTQTRAGALGLALGSLAGGDFTQTGCNSPAANFAVAFLLHRVVDFERYNNGSVVAVPVPAIDVTFGADYTMAAGTHERDQMRLSWTSAAPEFPPQPDDVL